MQKRTNNAKDREIALEAGIAVRNLLMKEMKLSMHHAMMVTDNLYRETVSLYVKAIVNQSGGSPMPEVTDILKQTRKLLLLEFKAIEEKRLNKNLDTKIMASEVVDLFDGIPVDKMLLALGEVICATVSTLAKRQKKNHGSNPRTITKRYFRQLEEMALKDLDNG